MPCAVSSRRFSDNRNTTRKESIENSSIINPSINFKVLANIFVSFEGVFFKKERNRRKDCVRISTRLDLYIIGSSLYGFVYY